MTRFSATISHLIISLIIFIGLMALLILKWYPPPYFEISGGWQGIKIAAGVDLVLGPLLTLIIFNVKKEKWKIRFDLCVIATMQFLALAMGVYTIYSERPLAAVFWEDSFYVVTASDLNLHSISKRSLLQFGFSKPVLIYAQKPNTIAGLKKLMAKSKEDSIPPYLNDELYRNLSEYFSDVKTHQVDIDEIIGKNDLMEVDLETKLIKHNAKINDFYYLPLRSKYRNVILMFNVNGLLIDNIVVSES